MTGERRAKDDDVFEAMGTVDELCSVVGPVYAEFLAQYGKCIHASSTIYADMPSWLFGVMRRLFDISSHVANPFTKHSWVVDDGDDEGGGRTTPCKGLDPAHVDFLGE